MKAKSGSLPHEQASTRYERIQSMSASELAFFLMSITKIKNDNLCPVSVIGGREMYDDKDCLFWLLEENEEGEGKI